ncbi:hypothetical protein PROFUN_15386 [Planoprotostelium fungivorum]|uniref:Uncharacterized protein n=1 Tax=Planoprotostelium fungivorum TaxID=1890364 RepID=A0A2P6MVD3_9EUKA|nr:hypothetical protein PROFUN_15386 [Planoprotostelium fungivorum]
MACGKTTFPRTAIDGETLNQSFKQFYNISNNSRLVISIAGGNNSSLESNNSSAQAYHTPHASDSDTLASINPPDVSLNIRPSPQEITDTPNNYPNYNSQVFHIGSNQQSSLFFIILQGLRTSDTKITHWPILLSSPNIHNFMVFLANIVNAQQEHFEDKQHIRPYMEVSWPVHARPLIYAVSSRNCLVLYLSLCWINSAFTTRHKYNIGSPEIKIDAQATQYNTLIQAEQDKQKHIAYAIINASVYKQLAIQGLFVKKSGTFLWLFSIVDPVSGGESKLLQLRGKRFSSKLLHNNNTTSSASSYSPPPFKYLISNTKANDLTGQQQSKQAAKDYGRETQRGQLSYITQTGSAGQKACLCSKGHCQEQLNGFCIGFHPDCIKQVQSTQTLTNVLQRITKQNTGVVRREVIHSQCTI